MTAEERNELARLREDFESYVDAQAVQREKESKAAAAKAERDTRDRNVARRWAMGLTVMVALSLGGTAADWLINRTRVDERLRTQGEELAELRAANEADDRDVTEKMQELSVGVAVLQGEVVASRRDLQRLDRTMTVYIESMRDDP